MYRLNLLRESTELGFHIALARGLLQNVRTMETPMIPPDSPIHLALDPYIARRLPNFMPIRVTELPPLTETWETLDGFLQYWRDVGHLVNSPSILKWEVRSTFSTTLDLPDAQVFLRSQVQFEMLFISSPQPRFIDRLRR